MREIKFRAWDKEEQKIYRVTMLDFPEWNVSVKNGEEFYKNGDRNSFKNAESDRCILMQYSGLKDKNGVEIYEGDIVESKCSIFLVDFRDGSFLLINEPTCRSEVEGECKTDILNKNSIGIYNLEVIGNVYENQGLLT